MCCHTDDKHEHVHEHNGENMRMSTVTMQNTSMNIISAAIDDRIFFQ